MSLLFFGSRLPGRFLTILFLRRQYLESTSAPPCSIHHMLIDVEV